MNARHLFHNALPAMSVFEIVHQLSDTKTISQWFLLQYGQVIPLSLIDAYVVNDIQFREFVEGVLSWCQFEAEYRDHKTETIFRLNRDSV